MMDDSLRLKKSEKLLFSLCDLSVNTLVAAISFYFIYFLINVAGISTSYCSFITLFAKVWEAFLDIFIGRISDRTVSRFGKKRVFILFTTPFFGLFFILMWVKLPDTVPIGAKVFYYLVMYTAFMSCYGILYVPYNSSVANLTNNYDERTSINGFRIAFANIGIILGAGIWSLLCVGKESLFYPVFKTIHKSYLITGIIFGIFSIIVLLIGCIYVRERFDNTEKSDKSFFQTIREVITVKQFIYVCITFAFTNTAVDIIMSLFLFYVSDSLDFGGGTIAMGFVAIPLVLAIATAAVWVILSEKFNKGVVYLAAVILISVALICAIFVPKKNYGVIAIVVVAGIGLSGIQIIPYALIPDVVEYDEYKFGSRREGIINGLVLLSYKISSAIFVSVATAIYGAAGYKESTSDDRLPQPEGALLSIRLLLGLMPTFFLALAVVPAFFGKLNRKEYQEVLEGLKRRREGTQSSDGLDSKSKSGNEDTV